jgi:hypothetical protein
MSEHFQEVIDFVMGDDESELGKTKAELAYSLHCLEREIAICSQAQARNEALAKALAEIRAHLGAILVQTIDSDDQIIIDHVRKAHELAGGKTP